MARRKYILRQYAPDRVTNDYKQSRSPKKHSFRSRRDFFKVSRNTSFLISYGKDTSRLFWWR